MESTLSSWAEFECWPQFASPSFILSQAQCEHMDMALTSQGLRGAAQFSQCVPWNTLELLMAHENAVYAQACLGNIELSKVPLLQGFSESLIWNGHWAFARAEYSKGTQRDCIHLSTGSFCIWNTLYSWCSTEHTVKKPSSLFQ